MEPQSAVSFKSLTLRGIQFECSCEVAKVQAMALIPCAHERKAEFCKSFHPCASNAVSRFVMAMQHWPAARKQPPRLDCPGGGNFKWNQACLAGITCSGSILPLP